MKILVVFFSMGGRTQIIAQNIASELHNAKVDIEKLILPNTIEYFSGLLFTGVELLPYLMHFLKTAKTL